MRKNQLREVRLTKKQRLFQKAIDKYPIVLYGGAKGGGKSFGLRTLMLLKLMDNPGTKGLLIRRTYDQIYINHILELYKEQPEMMNTYYSKTLKILTLPNGSTMFFRYLDRFEEVYNYAGQGFEFIGVDEITQHPEEFYPILRTSNRTTISGVEPRFFVGGNPGGIGHAWVKRLWIDRDFQGNENPKDYFFVPAKVYDNPILMENNPNYLATLEALPPDTRKALLEGDWNVFEGQYFSEWRMTTAKGDPYHVIEPFKIPNYWKRFIAIDWGYFPGWLAVGWYAVAPNKRLYKYKELSLQKHTARNAAKEIVRISGDDPIAYIAGDPSMWIKTQGEAAPTIAEELIEGGLPQTLLRKATHDRIIGWMMVHKYLAPAPDGLPWLQFFSTCTRNIKTLPALVHDPIKKEDLDDGGNNDHWADETRYACMTRPFRPEGAILGATPDLSETLRKTYKVEEKGKAPDIYADLIKKQLRGELDEPSDEELIPDYGDRP